MSSPHNGAGAGNGSPPPGFLAELARAVSARVEELRVLPSQGPDPALLDASKVIHEWPDLTAYIVEELR